MPKDFPQVLTPGECFCFWVSLLFVFFGFFWLLDSGAFIGYRAEEKTKTRRKPPKKKQSLRRNALRKDFWFLCYFCVLRVFWFRTRERSSATGLRNKQKKIERSLKKNKKHKAFGEMLRPMISSSFLCFFRCFF